MNNNDIFVQLELRIDNILTALVAYIPKYNRTLEQLHTCNVSQNAVYQRNYADFYKVRRRNENWKKYYFELLEYSKHKSNTQFSDVLDDVYKSVKRVDPSFCSKLVATINPDRPVIDSVVFKVLGLRQPSYHYSPQERIKKLVTLYDMLTDRIIDLIADQRFKLLKAKFSKANPDHSITDTKILDFLLWQLR